MKILFVTGSRGEWGYIRPILEIIDKDPNLEYLQSSIIEKIGLNVSIKNKKNNTGSIIFEYTGIDQLNKIIEIIKSNY